MRRGEVGEIVGRGPITMPGYYERPDLTAETIRDGWVYTGDLGYVATLELRTPSIPVLPLLGVSAPSDQLQFLAFFDYGRASPYRRAPGEADNQTAASVGVGLRYSVGPYLSLRVDHGVQLRGDTPLASRDRDQRTHIGVIIGY